MQPFPNGYIQQPLADGLKSSIISKFIGLGVIWTLITLGNSSWASSNADQAGSLVESHPEIEVNNGSHRLIYRRIKTPPLVERSVQEGKPVNTLTNLAGKPQSINAVKSSQQHEFLMLSCAVDRDGSSWVEMHTESEMVRFWSKADFSLLAHIQDVVTAQTNYSLFVVAWEARDYKSGWARPSSLFETIRNGSLVEWQLVGSNKPSPQALAAIQSLHNFLETNKDRLVREREELRRLSARLERQHRERDARPPDQLIEFFPIRSRHSSEASTKPADR